MVEGNHCVATCAKGSYSFIVPLPPAVNELTATDNFPYIIHPPPLSTNFIKGKTINKSNRLISCLLVQNKYVLFLYSPPTYSGAPLFIFWLCCSRRVYVVGCSIDSISRKVPGPGFCSVIRRGAESFVSCFRTSRISYISR